MDHTPGWELYRSFLAAFHEGSLSGAARALGLTQPTIGRHIGELERALGVALFTRSRHGLRPTDTARGLLPHAEAMAAAAEALLRSAAGRSGEIRGTLRLTASEIVGAEVLPAILADFRERHPAIVIELVLSNRNEDLLRRDCDIAVRMVRPSQSALVARRLGQVGLGLFAHRRYVERHRKPASLAALLRRPIIGVDRDAASLAAIDALGLPLTRDSFTLRTDNQLAQLAALRAGFGIGICQLGLARRDPDLVELLPGRFALALEVWLAMHEDLRASRPARLMFDHLAQALAGYVASSQPKANPRRAG